VKTKTVNRSFYRIVVPAVVLVVLLVSAGTASAQAIIKVNDVVNIKFGLLLQAWGDWQQTAVGPNTNGYAQNLFIRRMRLLMGGQVAKDVTFFLETDDPNLGKAPKSLSTGFILQDAWVEWKIADAFQIDGGLILIPLCRNCNTSAITLLTLDYASFSFLESGVTQSVVGRDTGFQAKGYLFGNHLEYRAGAYQGDRTNVSGSHNPFRFAGRLQYDFLDTETGFYYPGTYLGKKKIFSIGAGIDTQKDYMAYAFDGFFDYPVGGGNGITVEADYIKYDGGNFFTTLKKQDTFMGQAGFYLGGPKLLPSFRYEEQKFKDEALKVGNSRNYAFALKWFPHGWNFNVTAAYTYRQKPNATAAASTNEFTVQLQLFYF
jgi:Phosphate-selective porin O and P